MAHGSVDHFAVHALDFVITPDQTGVGQAPGDDDLQLPVIATDDDLDRFLLDRFGIVLPNVRVCTHRGHRTPWEAFHNAYFARDPLGIWKASRGFGGKSFTLALLALTEAITLRADVAILGGSGQQSKRVHESQKALWSFEAAPRGALKTEPGAMVSRFRWDNTIVALTASQTSVRGPHPQRLRMDEIDEMDPDILRSALGQPMSKGPVLSQVVLSSTHQYAEGTMTWALAEARVKDWPVYEWCLEETKQPHGWLTQDEIDRKRKIMTALDWKTEVELQEPTNEDPAILPEAIDPLFSKEAQLEDTPQPGAKYAHGADWAQRLHLTTITTLRKAKSPATVWKPWTMTLVKTETTNREPWPRMIQRFNDRVMLFKGPAAHDETGLGTVVADFLTVDAEGVQMVGNMRKALFSECIAGLENREVVIPDVPEPVIVRLRSVLKNLNRKQLYGTEHPPDEFVALALAYRAASQAEGGSGQLVYPGGQAPAPHLGSLAPNAPPTRPSDRIFGPRPPTGGGGIWGRRRGKP